MSLSCRKKVSLAVFGIATLLAALFNLRFAARSSKTTAPGQHLAGDDLTLDDSVDFTLDGENCWKDPIGRHWLGDELLEVDTKVPLLCSIVDIRCR